MPLEIGGRADKMGNRYEIKCIIYEMLKVLREVNYSIVIEALGDDEVGTDILITDFEGRKQIFWLHLLTEKKNINNVKCEMQVRNIGRFRICNHVIY